MPGVSTTCTATSPNGATTATATRRTRKPRQTIRAARAPETNACSAAAVGNGPPIRPAPVPEPVKPPPADPSTYLCDTQDAPAAQAEEWLSRFSVRTRLDEDDKNHVFKKRVVFLNDKVLAVLDENTANLAVYSRQTDATKLCATLQP